MSLAPLTVIPAGAGSGKTHTIQERLGEWVSAGLVRPEGIVAVTFTEAAATELRERIRACLIGLGRLDEAIRLDRAYISTIHGFGSRLLTEFAFENGSSPGQRLLNDDEQNVLVRQAIAQTDKVASMTRDLRRFGYTYEHGSERSAEDGFRDDILRLIGLLRATGWIAADPGYAAHAVDWIRARYGPTVDGARLTAALRASAEALLAAFPESFAGAFPGNKAATGDMRRDFRNLSGALEPGRLDGDWRLWSELGELRRSRRGAQLPVEYDALAEAVVAVAAELPSHPGPLASAEQQITDLVDAAQDVLVRYAEAKREAGLVDYTDMIALANALLGRDAEVLATLRARTDCLVVDEFQDTNPLQFALLWHLKDTGVPTLVVGDLKQAIMGFQGADPRLFEAVQAQNADHLEPLRRNWRSQAPIMNFVNAVGEALFPGAYTSLVPQIEASPLAPLEVLRFGARPKRDAHYERGCALGGRIRELLDDPDVTVFDRHTKQRRRLRGGDVAILCPTRNILEAHARALRARGIEVRLEEPGWLGSRGVQLALAALAYVANPADRHAALYLEVTELGAKTLDEGLRRLIDGERLASPLLSRLDTLAAQTAERTVYALVAETLAAIGLFDAVMMWPGARQQRANLLRLLAEAGEFMDAQREALAFGGYHGSGLQTFLAWLHKRAERDDTMPAPAVLDLGAVELVTWHSAKGREWPVVVVGGLDAAVQARLPNVELGYPDFDNLGGLLESAGIEYSPRLACRETNDRFKAPLDEQASVEARRLLYVALTRAREKLVIAWPEFLAGSEQTTYWSVLAAETGLAVNDDALLLGDTRFPCLVHVPAGAGSEDVVTKEIPTEALIGFGRRAIRRAMPPAATTPDIVSASSLVAPDSEGALAAPEIHRYAEPLAIDGGGTSFGTAIHRCFEVLGAVPDAAASVPDLLGVAHDDALVSDVSARVAAFEAWIEAQFPGAELRREWPVLAQREDGSVLTGAIDLLVVSGDEAWIIDHKSDQITDLVEALTRYRGQLSAYADAVEALETSVCGVGINWIRTGVVTMIDTRT